MELKINVVLMFSGVISTKFPVSIPFKSCGSESEQDDIPIANNIIKIVFFIFL